MSPGGASFHRSERPSQPLPRDTRYQIETHRDLDDPLIIPIPVECVCMRLVLSTHSDARPTKLLNGDRDFLEVRVSGENVCAKVERKVFRDENVVRNFGQIWCMPMY